MRSQRCDELKQDIKMDRFLCKYAKELYFYNNKSLNPI